MCQMVQKVGEDKVILHARRKCRKMIYCEIKDKEVFAFFLQYYVTYLNRAKKAED